MSNPTTPRLLLATSNPGKRREFRRLLPLDISVVDLAVLGISLPPEDGTTFAEIAARKAIAAAEQSGLPTLADDSGIVVDALHGLPGVRSARFAGEPTDDEANRSRLLSLLRDVPNGRRAARFVCAVALARPGPGTIVALTEGTCEGMIATSARGSFGFGYDPVFQLADGRTMAELEPDDKDLASHRAIAVRRILPSLIAELGTEATRRGHRR